MLTAPFAETGSTHDEVQDFLRKGDDDAACQSQETVGTLRRVVRLERQTDLNDTPAEQEEADRANEPEDEIGQIVYNCNRITCGKSSHASAHHKRKCKNGYYIRTVALLNLAGDLRLVLLIVLSIKILHFLFSPFHLVILRVLLQKEE